MATEERFLGGADEGARRWWAERWSRVVETLGLRRRAARSERVLRLDIGAGRVEAHVQGSRYEPYRVRIQVSTLGEEEWDRAVRVLSERALYAAKLLAGEIPREIDEALAAEGIALFPASARELRARCSCPRGTNRCAHVAAVYEVLGERLGEDPFVLFRLRGLDRESLLRRLRRRRASTATAETPAPRDGSDPRRFWSGASAPTISVVVAGPRVSGALWKRLGVPEFWRPHPEIRGAFERLYAKVTERAMALAYSGVEPSRDGGGDADADEATEAPPATDSGTHLASDSGQ